MLLGNKKPYYPYPYPTLQDYPDLKHCPKCGNKSDYTICLDPGIHVCFDCNLKWGWHTSIREYTSNIEALEEDRRLHARAN
jgi:hypothetical protein